MMEQGGADDPLVAEKAQHASLLAQGREQGRFHETRAVAAWLRQRADEVGSDPDASAAARVRVATLRDAADAVEKGSHRG